MSNLCDQVPELMDVQEALSLMQSQVSCQLDKQSLPIEQSIQRVLAQDVVAGIDVPNFANSAMDGYAFASQGERGDYQLQLVGTSLAGHPYQGPMLQPGQAVKITTGAVMPIGADCVVMQEQATVLLDQVHIAQLCPTGKNVRQRGEDIRQGEVLFKRGHRCRSRDLAVLASVGISQVTVYRRLKVAIFASGDELVDPRSKHPLAPGKIYQSNSFVMQAMLAEFGCDVLNFGQLADDAQTMQHSLAHACEQVDVVITSGGVSVGEADYLKTVLAKLGQIHFWKLAIKPGKPFAFGEINSQQRAVQFFALPGNPVSSTVTLHQLVLPVLAIMQGQQHNPPLCLPAMAKTAFKKRPGRTDYQRGVAYVEDNQLQVRTVGAQGSGVMQSLSQANCFVRLQRQRGDVACGEQVEILLFDHYI